MVERLIIVGATGKVGSTFFRILDERKILKFNHIYALASSRSSGSIVGFGSDKIAVKNIDEFQFKKGDLVLMSAGSDVSKKYAPIITDCGGFLIDNSSHFRTDYDIPLIVPEVNGDDIFKISSRKIVANPNCVAIQCCLPLDILNKYQKITNIVCSTYQSTSGAGRVAMNELFERSKSLFQGVESRGNAKQSKYPKDISFNCIPQIGKFDENGNTDEEVKIAREMIKILNTQANIAVTCVRVPVFNCHGVSLFVEFEEEVDEEEVFELLGEGHNGLVLLDRRQDGGYMTQSECSSSDNVFVSRLRYGYNKKSLMMWVVADNIRKGAALNAIQIAELLQEKNII